MGKGRISNEVLYEKIMHVHDKMELLHEDLTQDVKQLKHVLHGNGQKGVVEKVHKLEGGLRVINWLFVALIPAIGIILTII